MRTRIIVLMAICVAAIGGAAAYVITSRLDQRSVHDQPSLPSTSLAAVQSQPRILFRNTALGSQYGFVSMVPLSNPSGPRATTTTSCDRIYAVSKDSVCLASTRGVVTTYSAHVLGPNLQQIQTLPLSGIPSRARLSPDGNLAATTSFTSGDSYAGTSFSTRTIITKVLGSGYGSLEQFRLLHNGHVVSPVDRNYWGVTFASDDDTFYATVSWAGHTWLVRGSLSKRTMTTIQEDAECPSLSPDGSAIVYKQRANLPAGHWRLVRYELASARITPLAENRSVDDQVEWLNDDTVIYGLPRSGSQAAVDDVWSLPADGTGHPVMLIPQAWSPAVVR